MRCHYHPNTDATQKCVGCQKPLCALCTAGQPVDAPLCQTCQALTAAEDMHRAMAQRRDQAAQVAIGQKRRRLLRVAVGWVVILVCTGIFLARTPLLVRAFRPESPVRRGTYATDARTDACIGNLWRQSALLRQGKPPDPTLVCPASKRAYRVMDNGGNTTVACPEPGRHGLTELRVEKNRPAPMVRK